MTAKTDSQSSFGRISSGVEANTLVEQTAGFVYTELPRWRDDPQRPPGTSEEHLNGTLCDFLNVASADSFPMVHFRHEQRQTGRRRVDIAAKPSQTINVGQRQYTKYDPILVLEGKRLPTPGTAREQEYVTGLSARSGGIQRFRLGLHGADLNFALMVGYIESKSCADWFTKMNDWITTLSSNDTDPTLDWSLEDCLSNISIDATAKTSRCISNHERTDGSRTIRLAHLWVEMSEKL